MKFSAEDLYMIYSSEFNKILGEYTLGTCLWPGKSWNSCDNELAFKFTFCHVLCLFSGEVVFCILFEVIWERAQEHFFWPFSKKTSHYDVSLTGLYWIDILSIEKLLAHQMSCQWCLCDMSRLLYVLWKCHKPNLEHLKSQKSRSHFGHFFIHVL